MPKLVCASANGVDPNGSLFSQTKFLGQSELASKAKRFRPVLPFLYASAPTVPKGKKVSSSWKLPRLLSEPEMRILIPLFLLLMIFSTMSFEAETDFLLLNFSSFVAPLFHFFSNGKGSNPFRFAFSSF